ncbi:cytochrome o ubiquinol oxidase subunit IV [Roseomonas sp. NAR14]|uniref:Cytochrome bo(3) ubiquinol oxidase subunit 4 n=1 Tax=Roseomonas acroporae TaxID=2937791 RepID=A0A9X1Y6I2_9PROT|nr:cytochrome o ubiquinol oxidase subunit IV [Roseomonas acroporae]MCK8784869.1 cytochrome o ubiquinol oxidase subunit IV [Roseomonas acroporae]
MSQDAHTAHHDDVPHAARHHAAHGHAAHAHGGHHGDHGEAHGTLRDYLIGFLLSVVLTAIPFWLVMTRPLADPTTAVIIVVFAIVQVLVHMVYFLHMNGRAEGGWTMTALIFTIIVVFITISGSAWVLWHLSDNMMPMSHGMPARP